MANLHRVFREFDYIASRRDSTGDTSTPEGNLETVRQTQNKTYQILDFTRQNPKGNRPR